MPEDKNPAATPPNNPGPPDAIGNRENQPNPNFARKVDNRPRDGDSDYAPDELNADTVSKPLGDNAEPADALSDREPRAPRPNPEEPQLEFAAEANGVNHDRIDIVTYMANEFGLTTENARDIMVNLIDITVDGEKLDADPRSIPIEKIDGKTVAVNSRNRAVKFKYVLDR